MACHSELERSGGEESLCIRNQILRRSHSKHHRGSSEERKHAGALRERYPPAPQNDRQGFVSLVAKRAISLYRARRLFSSTKLPSAILRAGRVGVALFLLRNFVMTDD